MDGKMDTWTNQRLIKLTNQLLDGQMSTNGWIYKKKKQCLGQKRKKKWREQTVNRWSAYICKINK